MVNVSRFTESISGSCMEGRGPFKEASSRAGRIIHNSEEALASSDRHALDLSTTGSHTLGTEKVNWR